MTAFSEGVGNRASTGANHDTDAAIVCYVDCLYSLIPEEALP
jgi:hypothetical protein